MPGRESPHFHVKTAVAAELVEQAQHISERFWHLYYTLKPEGFPPVCGPKSLEEITALRPYFLEVLPSLAGAGCFSPLEHSEIPDSEPVDAIPDGKPSNLVENARRISADYKIYLEALEKSLREDVSLDKELKGVSLLAVKQIKTCLKQLMKNPDLVIPAGNQK